MVTTENKYTITIIDDEEDILNLYSDYLTRMGHRILRTYVNPDTILQDIDIEPPDVFIIDYRLPGPKNGRDLAAEILNALPTAPILFVTADEGAPGVVLKDPLLSNSRISILLKPVKLHKLEEAILGLLDGHST
jgi:DNA-binding NtrC family response regulator